MSQSDSFIEEVTEEVRRDQLYAYARRYGWIAGLVVVLIVGAVGVSEWRQSQARAAAQATGDAILAVLNADDSAARAEGLAQVDGAGAQVVVDFLRAGALAQTGEVAAAAALFDEVSVTGDLPQIYRQLAAFKSLTLQAETMPLADRRAGFEALAVPGAPLRLLAVEQLALIDIEAGAPDAAIARLEAALQDSEMTPDLQERALQVMVALGAEPDLDALGLTRN